MDQLDKFNRRYNFLSKLSAAFFYSIAVAVALNFFGRRGICTRQESRVLRN